MIFLAVQQVRMENDDCVALHVDFSGAAKMFCKEHYCNYSVKMSLYSFIRCSCVKCCHNQRIKFSVRTKSVFCGSQ